MRVCWAVIILTLLIYALESFVIVPPGRDSSAYIYVAKGILEGEVPYLDRWDHKGPLLYGLNAFGLIISDVWGVWLVEMIFLLGAVWFAFLATRDGFDIVPALLGVAILLGYFLIIGGENNSGTYATLFRFISLYLFLRIERGHDAAWYPVAIGVLAASAFLLLPSQVGLWVAIGLYWLVRRKDAMRRILLSVAGALPPILIVAGLFAIVGSLYELWDALFTYNLAYSDASLMERFISIFESRRMAFLLLPLIVIWPVALVYTQFPKGRQDRIFYGILRLGLILLPIEMFLISLSGLGYNQYYLSILTVAIIFTAFVVFLILDALKRITSLPDYFPNFVLLLCVLCLAIVALYNFSPARFEYLTKVTEKYTWQGVAPYDDQYMPIVDIILEETDPDDTILVYGGGETRLHLFSGRDAPTRFFYQFPLALRGYASPKVFDEFIAEIRDGEPALIIDTRKGTLPPLDRTEREAWETGTHRYVYMPDEFHPFLEHVSEEYELIDDINGYAIYRRI